VTIICPSTALTWVPTRVRLIVLFLILKKKLPSVYAELPKAEDDGRLKAQYILWQEAVRIEINQSLIWYAGKLDCLDNRSAIWWSNISTIFARFLSQLFSLPIFFYNLKKVKSNYLSTLWKAQRPSHRPTVLFPIYQIMIGPSDDGTIVQVIQHSSVLF
jgi:hypothetical protein